MDELMKNLGKPGKLTSLLREAAKVRVRLTRWSLQRPNR